MLKNLGWLITVLLAVFIISFIYLSYFPLKRELTNTRGELSMWEEMIKKEGEHLKAWKFTPDQFFIGKKIAPKGEVALALVFDSLGVYARGRTIAFSAAGDQKDFFLWLDRLDNVLRFTVKNCSIASTNYRFEFVPKKEEDFGIYVDD